MNSIIHFYARTCGFAYAPFKAYSYNRKKMTIKELKIGSFIGTFFYSIITLLPLMFLSKGDLLGALIFSFPYPLIIATFIYCRKEYIKETIEKKITTNDSIL